MPLDIRNEYIEMIKIGLKKKKEKYIKEYNILQSIKHNYTNLYDILIPTYQPSWDKSWGLITIQIEPTI
jgi:ASC-1-like (ASCH) protein